MRTIRYLLTNAAVLALAVAGALYGIDGAYNALGLWASICVVMGFLVSTKSGIADLSKKDPPTKYLDAAAAFDIALALFLAWHSAWVIAVMWILSSILWLGAWKKAGEIKAGEAV